MFDRRLQQPEQTTTLGVAPQRAVKVEAVIFLVETI